MPRRGRYFIYFPSKGILDIGGSTQVILPLCYTLSIITFTFSYSGSSRIIQKQKPLTILYRKIIFICSNLYKRLNISKLFILFISLYIMFSQLAISRTNRQILLYFEYFIINNLNEKSLLRIAYTGKFQNF